jgi:hypothetical protein
MSGEHASEKILGKIKILGKMSYLLKKKKVKKMRMNNDFPVYQPVNIAYFRERGLSSSF